MKIELRLLNCLMLIVPLLAWNIVLGPKLNEPRITSDAHSPQWLLICENTLRIFVFALPLLFPLQFRDTWSKAGLAIYVVGTLVYFASWLPLMMAPNSTWSNSTIGLLAPRLTPILVFLGIAFISHIWLYALISMVFTILHTWHGIQNL